MELKDSPEGCRHRAYKRINIEAAGLIGAFDARVDLFGRVRNSDSTAFASSG